MNVQERRRRNPFPIGFRLFKGESCFGLARSTSPEVIQADVGGDAVDPDGQAGLGKKSPGSNPQGLLLLKGSDVVGQHREQSLNRWDIRCTQRGLDIDANALVYFLQGGDEVDQKANQISVVRSGGGGGRVRSGYGGCIV